MNFRKKIVVIFLLFSITLGGVYIQAPRASALFGIGDTSITIIDIPRILAFIVGTAVRIMARKVLTMLSNSLINKIRGSGRDGGPAFVRNWRNFITDAQYRGEDIFKAVLASTPVCGYLDKNIKDAFGVAANVQISFKGNNVRVGDLDPFNLRAACTLPSNFDMAAYRNDFAGNGGWEAWSRLMEPQNNYYGLLFESLNELNKQRSLSEAADLAEATSGSGYTSVRDGCQDNLSNVSGGSNYAANARCTFMGKVFTPADLLGKSAAATIDTEMGWLISSQQIADIVINILTAVVDRVGNLAESALIGDSDNPENSYREEYCVARGPSTEAINYVKEKFPDAYAKFPPTLDTEKDGPIGGNFILASYCSTLQNDKNPYPYQNCISECLKLTGIFAPPLEPTPTPSGPPTSLEMAVCQNTKSNLSSGNPNPQPFVFAFGPSCAATPEGDSLGPYFCPTAKKISTQGVQKTDRQAMQKICRVSFCAHTQQQSQWWGWMDGGRNDHYAFSSAVVGDFCSKNLGWFGFDNKNNLPKDSTVCSGVDSTVNGYIGGGVAESFSATTDDPLAKCASQIVAPQPSP